MVRVVGCDPGTSSLDLLLLVDGRVADQARLDPGTLRDRPGLIAESLGRWGPIDLVAGPSGYGLPLVRGEDVTEREIDLMAWVRPDERGRDSGVVGFRHWVRAVRDAGWPSVFLPGGIHLPTIPAHRKVNAIDLGTADKVCVAALACWADLRAYGGPAPAFAVVEVGSAFTAVLVIEGGRVVDAAAGTRGPIGMKSGGAWDGEVAYGLSPLAKADLFRGGVRDLGDLGPAAFRESLVKHVAGLRAVTPFGRIYVSGSAITEDRDWEQAVTAALSPLGEVRRLPDLPGAWVKAAAQGAALVADGLLGGEQAGWVEALALRAASGTIGDALRIRPSP